MDQSPEWVYADSGGFIALFLTRDQYHESAHSFQQAFTGLVYTTPLVIAETHDFLLYQGGSQPARRFLEAIREEQKAGDVRLISISGERFDTAYRIIERYSDRTLTLVDAVGLAFLQTRDKPRWVFGYDDDFRLLDRCLLVPKDID